jgi:signal transduction histidine kinase
LPLAVFLLLLVALIVLFGRLLTRKMAWRVLRPLEELTDAAERVKNGNLSVPIAYSGSDEFSYVCTTFNQMQEHLKNEREKNAAYERARIDLIAGLSHDIRTPLTSVKGFIKGLRDGVANTPEKQEQYLSIAYDKACDIDMLLQKLFYFSNLETGKFTLSRTDEDLGVFASEFTESVQNELFILNIEIAADVTSVPHPVQIDTEQMRRVLLNLVENAVKYVQSEPRKITVSVWRENNMEHLLFADNGQGVPEEHLPHLFERFWRGDEARRTQKGDGSGIGLYIARRIVEAHGGRIEALNNNGLQIEIYLPCRKGEHE